MSVTAASNYTAGMMFLFGCLFGQAVTWFTIWIIFVRPDDTTTIDLWWAENPERWVGLRQILLDEAAAGVSPQEAQ
jgi:hypothetical protein